jgi:hypothetical protein
MIARPRLRGEALICFTKHNFDSLIQTRLGSISLRTRSNRRVAFKLLWRYLVSCLVHNDFQLLKFQLISRSFVQSYNRFILPYILIRGFLVYADGAVTIERLFGRRFKLPIQVYNLLMEKRRLPLFTETRVIGFG